MGVFWAKLVVVTVVLVVAFSSLARIFWENVLQFIPHLRFFF